MKKIFTILVILIYFNISYSQTGNSPYPVIFIHGLNSDDHTWDATLTKLATAWSMSANHTFSAVINARGGDTTNYTQDVVVPLIDAGGNIVYNITASNIYALNFGNFWNRNSADPRIILYNNATPGASQSPSNQSSIFKQVYVLRMLIDTVLRVTGASKVILAGHSMGGLAIREYLQRRENGVHKWWVNPADILLGHRVAKVVTIGTPHLGTNLSSGAIFGIDDNSEAMRDLKFSYPSGAATYLFGNTEAVVPSSYYNKDVNCNGFITDTLTGLSSGTTDNSIQPLPQNILYTWITSNYLGLGTDGAVPLNRQSLYSGSTFIPAGLADSIMTNKNHVQETGDTRSLIRGLDEPDNKNFAFDVGFNKLYSGFITLQPNTVTSDSDYYKIQTTSGGKVTVTLKYLSSGVTIITLLSSVGVLVSKAISAADDSISIVVPLADNYYIRISGSSSLNPNQNYYSFTTKFVPSADLDLTSGIEGMWNGVTQVRDTLRVYLRNNFSPFNKTDSATVYPDNSGTGLYSFLNAVSGNYYIQQTHRNALETWSSSPVSFTNGAVSVYDFTDSVQKAFGNNQIYNSGRWCAYSGDVNNEGSIDVTDLVLINNDALNFEGGYINTDLTGDNITDVSDVIIAYNNSNNFVSVIRP